MRIAHVVAFVALAGLSGSAVPAGQATTETMPRLRAHFPDVGGQVLEPGEEVSVAWQLSGPGVKAWENHPWGECELLFSADGGRSWQRITPRLSIARRDYTWVVPDVPTRNGRLALQLGIEGDGEFHQFVSRSFRIRRGTAGAVRLLPPAGALRGGAELELAWSSTVADLDRFEVLVSADRGAHFFRVGETTTDRLVYEVPAEFEGDLTVQVVAHRHGKPALRSALDASSTFRISAAGSPEP